MWNRRNKSNKRSKKRNIKIIGGRFKKIYNNDVMCIINFLNRKCGYRWCGVCIGFDFKGVFG